jgi:ribonuclease-3
MTTRDRVSELEDRIGYAFQDRELALRALTHASYGDGRRKVANYERLEFLGDRVLGFLVAERLFREFSDDEGALARRLNALVRKEACARAAVRAGLGDALRLSKSAAGGRGRENVSILGDACEALLAAIYLDGGIEPAHAFFERFWADEFAFAAKGARDPKTRLQEWALARFGANPTYRTLKRSGPDHRPVFAVEVVVGDLKPERGEGGSKRAAEESAAKAMLAREDVNG